MGQGQSRQRNRSISGNAMINESAASTSGGSRTKRSAMSVNQAEMSTKQALKQVFQDYYLKLVEILPMKDATFKAELVSHGLLPGDLKDQLEAQNTTKDKATHFLDDAIKPSISIDDDSSLAKLLSVMANSDFKGVKNLAKQIKDSLADDGK